MASSSPRKSCTLRRPSSALIDAEVEMRVIKTGLTKSGKEAKRLISENGARLNGVLVTDISQTVNILDFNKPLKLSAGKKRHVIIDLQK